MRLNGKPPTTNTDSSNGTLKQYVIFVHLIFSDQQNRQFHEQFLQTVAQVMCGQLTERLAAVLLKDLTRNVVSTIGTKMDSIKAQIQADVAQKLVSSDQLLRDNITKACSNKVSV